jgi:hypothetical protein
MTREQLLETWDELGRQAASPNIGPYLHLQLSGGEVPIGAILRVEDLRPGLLVRFPVADSQRIPKPDSGRGYLFERHVAVSSDTLGLPILVADPEAREIFASMAADLVTAVQESRGRGSAVDVVLQRIALWRRFLQRRVALLKDEDSWASWRCWVASPSGRTPIAHSTHGADRSENCRTSPSLTACLR